MFLELERLNNGGAGIFVTINETNGRGRKGIDIVRVRALHTDLDGAPLGPVLAYVYPSWASRAKLSRPEKTTRHPGSAGSDQTCPNIADF